jgi:pimeloyl-ACP methyl ester carboxylesterase
MVALAGFAGASMAAPTPTPAERIGTLQVQRYGDHGRPVILIPGLECGPWVWQRTIAGLEKDHVVYAVTLAGFDGVPAPAPDAKAGTLLDRADASLLELIQQKHIDKPVLVGHSIGGTLSLRFAGEHAKRAWWRWTACRSIPAWTGSAPRSGRRSRHR